MTNIPKIGFFCTGKTPLELSVSVRSAYKAMELMREEGYMTGACYTEIIDIADGDCVRRAGKTLEHLCLSNELVLTFGCEGYSQGDIVPDITDVLCRRKASYFAYVLCGAEKIKKPAKQLGDKPDTEKDKPLRIYPASDGAVSLDSFSDTAAMPDNTDKTGGASLRERLADSLQKLTFRSTFADEQKEGGKSHIDSSAILKILSKNRSARRSFDSCADYASAYRSEDEYIHILPSRATAGILDKTLILNLTNDCCAALQLLSSLAPAIGFAVYNLSGKSAAAAAEFESQVKNRLNCDEVLKKICIING